VALFFRASNGRIIVHPGGVTVVDASGGLQPSISLTGIVGIVGTAAGGEPWIHPDGVQRGPIAQIDDPGDGRAIFGAGPLADALFNPSADPRIVSGAFRVLAIKLNRSTRSVADVQLDQGGAAPFLLPADPPGSPIRRRPPGAILRPGDLPNPVPVGFLRLWSKDWGPDTENIRVALVSDAQPPTAPPGSPAGTAPSVFQPVTSFYLQTTFRNLKEDSPVFRLPHYRALASGGHELDAGDSVFTVHFAAPAGSTALPDLRIGVTTAPQPDGTFVATTMTFSSAALFPDETRHPNHTLTVLSQPAPGAAALLPGSIVASTYRQLFALVAPLIAPAGYSFVPTNPAMSLDRPWTVLDALSGAAAPENTDPDMAGAFNHAPGPGLPPRVDVTLTSYVRQLVDWINTSSRLLTGEPHLDRVLLPRDPADPIYLPRVLAGTDGLHHANDAQWYLQDFEEALDALLQVRINELVPLISDPRDIPVSALAPGDATGDQTLLALHLLARDHCRLAEGAYKSERNAFIAYDTPFGRLRQHAARISDRNVSLCAQGVSVLDALGNITALPAWAMACIAAGLQAGAPIGEPLTFKFGNVLGLSQPGNTWSPRSITDSNTLLQAGVLFMEPVDGKGFRFVRDLTTYLFDDNLIFTDRNVNYAVNTVSYELRTELEQRFTGLRALPATVGAMREAAVAKLEALRDAGVIVDSFDEARNQPLYAYRQLSIRVRGDVAFVRVAVSPVTGIAFIEIVQKLELPVLRA
jgi:hypothetical protein